MHEDIYKITWLIRRTFRAMENKAGIAVEKFGITLPERAVIEFLYPDKSLTVPHIAHKFNVSRQHIQTTVNTLIDKHYLSSDYNPEHKRSKLMKLTSKGIKKFTEIYANDIAILNTWFSNIKQEDIVQCKNTLEKLLIQINK